MPRGFKKPKNTVPMSFSYVLKYGGSAVETRLIDPRSFISQGKVIKGECTEPKAHLILYGEDKGPIRAEIFRHNREANGGFNKCWKCLRPVCENLQDVADLCSKMPANPHDLIGEWDHIRNKAGERCDCPENGRVACRQCHKERHPQTRFGK